MNAWTALTMFSAALVVARMVRFVNLIQQQRRTVPQHVVVAIILLAAGAATYFLAPLWGESYTWRDAVFSAAVAIYARIERRAPVAGRVLT